MMNPISAVTWSWRALRGHSITFSVLFASSVLGLSVVSALRSWLTRGGAPWYLLILAPIVTVAVLARKEKEWVPDPEARRKWARGIFIGSLAVSALVAYFHPDPPPDPNLRPRPVTQPFHKIPR